MATKGTFLVPTFVTYEKLHEQAASAASPPRKWPSWTWCSAPFGLRAKEDALTTKRYEWRSTVRVRSTRDLTSSLSKT
jgi:hypothetical protein